MEEKEGLICTIGKLTAFESLKMLLTDQNIDFVVEEESRNYNKPFRLIKGEWKRLVPHVKLRPELNIEKWGNNTMIVDEDKEIIHIHDAFFHAYFYFSKASGRYLYCDIPELRYRRLGKDQNV